LLLIREPMGFHGKTYAPSCPKCDNGHSGKTEISIRRVSDPPAWLNWLAIITGISGVTISAIIGWIVGGIPPEEPRSYRQSPSKGRNEGPVRRQSPPPQVSWLDEVKWALFKLIVRPDLPISTHLAWALGGSIPLFFTGYLYFFQHSDTVPDLPIFPVLWKVVLFFSVLFGLLVVFSVARLRWRMRYESWRRSQEYNTND